MEARETNEPKNAAARLVYMSQRPDARLSSCSSVTVYRCSSALCTVTVRTLSKEAPKEAGVDERCPLSDDSGIVGNPNANFVSQAQF